MKEYILRLDNLTLGYPGGVVIREANFGLRAGDFVCVVGANGSGKSTLIKGMLGLLKPLSGEVVFGGGLVKGAIGYLPQETRLDTNFPATVSEIVLSGTLGRMGARPFYGLAERRSAEEAMKRLGIEKLARESFASLSGGQKQKVLLARSLSATSELLILDEPSNNLDFDSRKEFYKVLRRLNRDEGLTIVMITHDLDADDLIGDKVVAVKDGKVKMYTTKSYLESFR